MTAAEAAERYPVGSELRFAAGSEIAQDHEEPVLASGIIVGRPLVAVDDCGLPVVYVPAWVQRDHGREATTVLVHSGNVLAVVPKTRT